MNVNKFNFQENVQNTAINNIKHQINNKHKFNKLVDTNNTQQNVKKKQNIT